QQMEDLTRKLLATEELTEQEIEDAIGHSVHGSVAELDAKAAGNFEAANDNADAKGDENEASSAENDSTPESSPGVIASTAESSDENGTAQ
ncbi:MAG: hypothetical protein AAF483_00245, partial [Planctomycetota bacterium]